MAQGDFKNLAIRTASDKVLSDKAFNITKNLKYGRYQRCLPSMIYKFLGKKSSGGAVTRAKKMAIKSKIMANQRPLDLLAQLTFLTICHH